MALLVALLVGVGAIVCTMIGAFGYKKWELKKEKRRSGFSSRSLGGGSDGGDDSPNPGRNSGRSGSSSRFLVVRPRGPREKEAFSRRSIECFSPTKLRKESSSLRTPLSRRWVYSPGPFASKLREEGFSFRFGGAGSSLRSSSKSFLLAVVDLSRVKSSEV